MGQSDTQPAELLSQSGDMLRIYSGLGLRGPFFGWRCKLNTWNALENARRRFVHCITPVKAPPAPLRCAPAGDSVCRDILLP
jgi:hypothetical protein